MKRASKRDNTQAVQAAMPGSVESIVRETGLSLATVHRRIRMLHWHRECFVTRYDRARNGNFIAVYDMGSQEDVIRPMGMHVNERVRRSKERRRLAERGPEPVQPGIRRDPLVAALFGAA